MSNDKGKTLYEIFSGTTISPEDPPDAELKAGSDESSAALVAMPQNGHHGGCIVQAKPGCPLYYDMHEVGGYSVSDYGLDDAPPGISIWEGTSSWVPGGFEYPQDGEVQYNGTFRRLTVEELAKLQAGQPIWPPMADDEPVEQDEHEHPAT